MNVIVRNKAKITPEERARRKAAVDYARGSVRLEGFVLSHEAEELYRLYIEGKLADEELEGEMLSRFKK